MAESISHDGGLTWDETRKSGIVAADTRHYISRLASGRVLLVYNSHPKNRTNMTIALSEDDGATWKYRKTIASHQFITYPDAQEKDGVIYRTYDYKRIGEREILFAKFTEDDIINGKAIEVSVVSKPTCPPQK